MRLPFPERIPLERTALFAVGLFMVQQLEHTALYFSVGCVVFLLVATLAFNIAGGLTRTSGVYVFFYSVLVVVIGLCYKAYLGEPADSNLQDPLTTIEVYVGGICAMLAAVVISRRFSRKTGLLQNLMKDSDMYRSSVGCMVIGIGVPFLISMLGQRAAWLRTAFTQLNQLIALAIIIGVMYEIRRSGGTRSLTQPSFLSQSTFLWSTGSPPSPSKACWSLSFVGSCRSARCASASLCCRCLAAFSRPLSSSNISSPIHSTEENSPRTSRPSANGPRSRPSCSSIPRRHGKSILRRMWVGRILQHPSRFLGPSAIHLHRRWPHRDHGPGQGLRPVADHRDISQRCPPCLLAG